MKIGGILDNKLHKLIKNGPTMLFFECITILLGGRINWNHFQNDKEYQGCQIFKTGLPDFSKLT